MLTTLPNGKTIDLPIDVIFLSDEQYALYIQMLTAADSGDMIDNFFFDSSLEGVNQQKEDEIEEFIDESLLERDDI